MPAPNNKFVSWAAEILALPNDSRRKTVFVALALCLVCSIVVSGAAVILKPLQAANQALDRKRNIVAVAGLVGGRASAWSRPSNRLRPASSIWLLASTPRRSMPAATMCVKRSRTLT